MTKDEINVTIAEICGWTNITPDLYGTIPNAAEFDSQGALEHLFRLPDYFCDLNAMHDAEKLLVGYPAKDWDYYITNLHDITQTKGDGSLASIAAITHATAEQRAEAFLYVFSKWKK